MPRYLYLAPRLLGGRRPQLSKTGRPEARARGSRCDVTLTDAALPVQAALSRAGRHCGRRLLGAGVAAIAASEEGPAAACGQGAGRKRLLDFLHLG